jgi:uncharacterized protein DUF4446
LDKVTLFSAAALAAGVIGCVLALVALRRMSSARRSLAMLQGKFEGQTLIDAVAAYAGQVRSIGGEVAELWRGQQELLGMIAASNRHAGLVRYDAFEDMGGKLSFSAAMLDDGGNGLVLSSINGRSESRVYAKLVSAGNSDQNLSPEEQAAIAEALGPTRRRVAGGARR